jgi:hypothetical protein
MTHVLSMAAQRQASHRIVDSVCSSSESSLVAYRSCLEAILRACRASLTRAPQLLLRRPRRASADLRRAPAATWMSHRTMKSR